MKTDITQKVLVIGATGKIGRLALTALAAEGHKVTAFGRSADRIAPFDGLRVKKGDVTSASDLDAAMRGHDTVILTFGAPLNRQTILHGTDVCEVGTRNVVAAMKNACVPRLIAMTSIGAGSSAGQGRWPFRNFIAPVILRNILRDRTAQEEVVIGSDLPEWAIVRPAELTDGVAQESLREFTVFDDGPGPTVVSRASVAGYLAKLVTDKRYDGSAVLISE
ncbi:NAD(P)-binding oxidoreductase [Cognatiyoonia sp. IB215182]|uniref:NAD(P)-dependent oxidoreductase n=1 Tax=Cognatiyoonia sp. IB215182 TaxID=3097353 RepID=UPI002A0FD343|nr:NAD(P)-binding oxidoreductase [Cognatiyoonia sp. IB215182]MDX8355205.1 NAD(P)-binding oxidoreductase [Cognatiyoonia sp. IB215182]